MKSLLAANKGFWTPQNKRSMYLGLLLLGLSLMIQVSAGRYSERRALNTNFAGDMFLDNLPVLNLDYVIVQGALAFFIFSIVLFAFHPRHALFGVKAIALFVIVRAFFINLTHIGIYPENTFTVDGVGSWVYNAINFNGNFFFSGHTGMSFLIALIFWREKLWRRLYLVASIVFGASVLLAHVHYSIDVFAAPFITYSIMRTAAKLFPKDYALTASEPESRRVI
jgi:membrane-associated phospholipid phosphatase